MGQVAELSFVFWVQVADPVLGEVVRTYRVHVPRPYNLNNEVAVPLVMDYHGYGSGAEWQEMDSNFIGTSTLNSVSIYIVCWCK